MTCEKITVPRSNFASRLLDKAIAERGKTGEIRKPIVSEKTESFAPPVVEKPEAVAIK